MSSKGIPISTSNICEHDNVSRKLSFTVFLKGSGLKADCLLIVLINGIVVLEEKWKNGVTLSNEINNFNLNDRVTAAVMADTPLVVLLREAGGKPSKEIDNLTNIYNRAGANVDLLPLLLGEDCIQAKVNLVYILTGIHTGSSVEICINTDAGKESRAPLLITLTSAYCLPQQPKEGTVHVAAISLSDTKIQFGMSLLPAAKKHIVWASIGALGYSAISSFGIRNEDMYVANELETSYTYFEYWNVCKRILIDNEVIRVKLEKPFLIEVAGVPKSGKVEVRGHYMGFVDPGALLEPNQYGVAIATKLYYFNESKMPENVTPLIDLPPASAKTFVKEPDDVVNEQGQAAFAIINLNLIETLEPQIKLSPLYSYIGVNKDKCSNITTEVLHVTPPLGENYIDVRNMRKEKGALSVHSELSGMGCTGVSILDRSIKKTAINKLLNRVKSMLQDFPPGKCSTIDRQDIITAQHSAARRAVTASFAPQPPPILTPSTLDAARSRLAGDERIANIATETTIQLAPLHPKSFLVKALRCLEKFNDKAAQDFLYQGLQAQPQNKYLLWAFGAQVFNKVDDGINRAIAVFQIAAKARSSDGTSLAIEWAALHGLYHFANKTFAAFVAAKNMRKGYKLPKDWKGFLQRWTDISGQEDFLWVPQTIDDTNPLLITSAFFLCLRAFRFVEIMLNCCETKCFTRGTVRIEKDKELSDVCYLRAASFLIQGDIDKALAEIENGIQKFGPSAKFSQFKASCLLRASGWEGICEYAFIESEKSGAEYSPALLLRAALGGVKADPKTALQRAARAHKAAPSAHSAFVIARVYMYLNEEELSERWSAAAVDLEPNLADGWAFLAIISIRKQEFEHARSLLRTAYQVGPISDAIKNELNKLKNTLPVESLPDSLMKDLCLCDFC